MIEIEEEKKRPGPVRQLSEPSPQKIPSSVPNLLASVSEESLFFSAQSKLPELKFTQLEKYARWNRDSLKDTVSSGSTKAEHLTAKLFDEPLLSDTGSRSDDLARVSLSDEKESTDSRLWKCDKCTYENKESFLVCEICESRQLVKDQESSKWTCLVCTFEDNSNEFDPICKICGRLPVVRDPDGNIKKRPMRAIPKTQSRSMGRSGYLDKSYADEDSPHSTGRKHTVITLPEDSEAGEFKDSSVDGRSVRLSTLPSIPSPFRKKSAEVVFSIGDRVMIRSLTSMKEYNGREGYISSEKDVRGRHEIILMNSKRVICKISNIELIKRASEIDQQDSILKEIFRAQNSRIERSERNESFDSNLDKRSSRSTRFKRMFSIKRDVPTPLTMKSSVLWVCRISTDTNDDKSSGPASANALAMSENDQIRKRLAQLKDSASLLKEFRDSLNAAKNVTDFHIRKLEDAQSLKQQCEERKKAAIQRWESYALYDLLNLARNYFENKLLYLAHKRDITALHVEIFSTRWQLLVKADEQLRQRRKDYTADDIRQSVETAIFAASQIQFPERLKVMEQNTAALAQVVQQVKEKYDRVRAEAENSEVTDDERKTAIKEFLDKVLEKSWWLDTLYRHNSDVANILQFQQFLLDQRQFEGKCIRQWRAMMTNPDDEFSLDNVSTFLERLTHTFCVNQGLNQERYHSPVRLLVTRVLFPKIYDILLKLPNAEAQANDRVYSEKAAWLRLVSESALGIEEKFCHTKPRKKPKLIDSKEPGAINEVSDIENDNKSDVEKEEEDLPLAPSYPEIKFPQLYHLSEEKRNENFPYGHPIYIMHQINSALVPDDQADYLHRAIQAIQAASHSYSNDKQPLDADGLFPILIFVILHSRLDNVFQLTSFFETFLPEEAAYRGQTGFCFSLFKAAISFVKGQDKEKYKLPVECSTEL